MKIISLLLPSLGFLIPMLSGIVTNYALQLLKRLSLALDLAPAGVKQLANAVLAIVVVGVANFLGVAVVGDATTWAGNVPTETVQAIAAALIAHVIHSGKKSDEAKALARNVGNVPNPFELP